MGRDVTDPGKFWVEVTGREHPHVGRRGYVEVVDNKVTFHNIMGTPMLKVIFGEHDACFAEQKELKPSKEQP